MFCPRCGTILRLKEEKGKKILACSCGYVADRKVPVTIKETVKAAKEIEVMDEDATTLPKTKVVCPRCSHDEAYFWLNQTRGSDEPETKFFRCEKCKHVWRDYG